MADANEEEREGYGRPPKRHQFKPGQSGNPRGRPRTAQTVPEIVARVRDELIPITIDGKRKKVSLTEAALRQSIGHCLKSGNPRNLEKLLQLLERFGVTPQEVMAQDARAEAEAAVNKIFSYMERTHPVQDPAAQSMLEDREVDVVNSFPECRATLEALWSEQDADRGGTAPSGIRRQIQGLEAY